MTNHAPAIAAFEFGHNNKVDPAILREPPMTIMILRQPDAPFPSSCRLHDCKSPAAQPRSSGVFPYLASSLAGLTP